MDAIPQWLKAHDDDVEPLHGRESLAPENARGQRSEESHAQSREIPIFCAGGCGEVVGYFSQGQTTHMGGTKEYENWCPACEAAEIAKRRFARPDVPLANTDELAGLREPSRNLGWLRAFQVASVVFIIAGSVYISMGRVAGIYLAVLGTLGWLASVFAIWKLRD